MYDLLKPQLTTSSLPLLRLWAIVLHKDPDPPLIEGNGVRPNNRDQCIGSINDDHATPIRGAEWHPQF